MPIYEYQCEACGHKLEKLQKISDDPLRDCPSCDEPSLSKLVSAAAFRLKGSGWYETDFKSGKKKNVIGSDSSGSSDSGSSSGAGSSSGSDSSSSGSDSKSSNNSSANNSSSSKAAAS